MTNAMWRAAGQGPPVMLGRPDLASARDADGWVSFPGLRLRRSPDGGVTFAIGGNSETLTAAQARQCAAVAVALADEADPGPAEVGEWAREIHAELEPGCVGDPGGTSRAAARVALRKLREREEGRG